MFKPNSAAAAFFVSLNRALQAAKSVPVMSSVPCLARSAWQALGSGQVERHFHQSGIIVSISQPRSILSWLGSAAINAKQMRIKSILILASNPSAIDLVLAAEAVTLGRAYATDKRFPQRFVSLALQIARGNWLKWFQDMAVQLLRAGLAWFSSFLSGHGDRSIGERPGRSSAGYAARNRTMLLCP